MRFDWVVSIGNVMTAATMLMLAIMAWKDLAWRIKNLESWRGDHMVDSNARDSVIRKLDVLLERLQAVTDDRIRPPRSKGD